MKGRKRRVPPDRIRQIVQGADLLPEDEDLFRAVLEHHHENSGRQHIDLTCLLGEEEKD